MCSAAFGVFPPIPKKSESGYRSRGPPGPAPLITLPGLQTRNSDTPANHLQILGSLIIPSSGHDV